jgi:hypothetical protein
MRAARVIALALVAALVLVTEVAGARERASNLESASAMPRHGLEL